MTSVYNLLREACGISQAEAAERIHETRLDTVKSWCSDRRPAPSWAINQLQSLSRRIRAAGEDYAALIRQTSKGNVFMIGLAHDDQDARTCGFPSSAAQLQAAAIAISLLPDDADIRLVPRVRGAIPAPVMEPDKVKPTATDSAVLAAMSFAAGGFCYAQGNLRKYERLEDIGWVKHRSPKYGDVGYYPTAAGNAQLALIAAARIHQAEGPDTPSQVRSSPRRRPFITLAAGKQCQIDSQPLLIDRIDGNVVTARLSNGEEAMLYADQILL